MPLARTPPPTHTAPSPAGRRLDPAAECVNDSDPFGQKPKLVRSPPLPSAIPLPVRRPSSSKLASSPKPALPHSTPSRDSTFARPPSPPAPPIVDLDPPFPLLPPPGASKYIFAQAPAFARHPPPLPTISTATPPRKIPRAPSPLLRPSSPSKSAPYPPPKPSEEPPDHGRYLHNLLQSTQRDLDHHKALLESETANRKSADDKLRATVQAQKVTERRAEEQILEFSRRIEVLEGLVEKLEQEKERAEKYAVKLCDENDVERNRLAERIEQLDAQLRQLTTTSAAERSTNSNQRDTYQARIEAVQEHLRQTEYAKEADEALRQSAAQSSSLWENGHLASYRNRLHQVEAAYELLTAKSENDALRLDFDMSTLSTSSQILNLETTVSRVHANQQNTQIRLEEATDKAKKWAVLGRQFEGLLEVERREKEEMIHQVGLEVKFEVNRLKHELGKSERGARELEAVVKGLREELMNARERGRELELAFSGKIEALEKSQLQTREESERTVNQMEEQIATLTRQLRVSRRTSDDRFGSFDRAGRAGGGRAQGDAGGLSKQAHNHRNNNDEVLHGEVVLEKGNALVDSGGRGEHLAVNLEEEEQGQGQANTSAPEALLPRPTTNAKNLGGRKETAAREEVRLVRTNSHERDDAGSKKKRDTNEQRSLKLAPEPSNEEDENDPANYSDPALLDLGSDHAVLQVKKPVRGRKKAPVPELVLQDDDVPAQRKQENKKGFERPRPNKKTSVNIASSLLEPLPSIEAAIPVQKAGGRKRAGGVFEAIVEDSEEEEEEYISNKPAAESRQKKHCKRRNSVAALPPSPLQEEEEEAESQVDDTVHDSDPALVPEPEAHFATVKKAVGKKKAPAFIESRMNEDEDYIPRRMKHGGKERSERWKPYRRKVAEVSDSTEHVVESPELESSLPEKKVGRKKRAVVSEFTQAAEEVQKEAENRKRGPNNNTKGVSPGVSVLSEPELAEIEAAVHGSEHAALVDDDNDESPALVDFEEPAKKVAQKKLATPQDSTLHAVKGTAGQFSEKGSSKIALSKKSGQTAKKPVAPLDNRLQAPSNTGVTAAAAAVLRQRSITPANLKVSLDAPISLHRNVFSFHID